MTRTIAPALALLLILGAGRTAAAQSTCGNVPDMLIVLDRSGSMSLNNKWTEAKTAINNLLTAYTGTIRFGLMLFPSSGLCNIKFVQVGVGDNTQAAIMSVLNATTPSGNGTPLAFAMVQANAYLTSIDPGKTKYVLVITDGYNTCTPVDPAAEVTKLLNNGIKTFVVGFGSGVDASQLNAMATAGGTALSGSTKYYQANNQTSLSNALQAIAGTVSCCGNGVLDTGEKCDTAITTGSGKCPTASDCDDGKACTKDTLTGTLCNTSCTHTNITTAVNGDGCCPTGATSLTDTDCPVVCGNGVVEAGETCDTKIASGSGVCPSLADCDDLNVCTADKLQGSGCTLKCVNTTLTANLGAKDGCCPTGATSLTDLDCPVVCGNGVLESGETCDTKITSGTGKCPTLSDCNDGKVCTTDSLSGGSCTVTCQHTAVKPSLGGKDGCCPAGATSLTDSDCPVVCGNGVLESGEACDTKITSGAGACPTLASCNDGDVCTADSLTGSGCSLKCSNSAIGASLSAKDGCCPSGATSATDLDCSVACGNGVLESGETCDPKITSGAGKCPTLASCNDGKVCTKDALTGGACTLKCTNTALGASLSAKDGCCPAGATSKTDLDCAVACGNGVLESGETCDSKITSGAGKCPVLADCNDGNVCTTDTLTGSACTLKCVNSAAQPSLTAKDGCCPTGATSLTDLDCSAGCGNGVLEAGETCDPKITSGTGKCPTLADCNDGKVCTADTLAGGACSLVCVNLPVKPDATKTDGCCPPGASSVTDKDCKAVCGNSVLEPGEKCDTGITTGPGACPKASDCDDGDKCTTDTLAGVACLAVCVNTAFAPDATTKDGCCPQGHSSKTDADCLPPCGPDKTKDCIDLCKGVTCKTGQYCKEGKCVGFGDAGVGTLDGATVDDGGVTSDGWYADSSGCNCRVSAARSPGAGLLALLAAAALGLLIRRRRRRRRR